MDLSRRSQLTEALVRRSVVQGTLMRSTIHVVSRRDYPGLAAGIRATRRDWWMTVARSRQLQDFDYDALAAVVRRELMDGPRTRAALVGAIEAAGYPKALWEAVGLWVDMVRVPPSGTWERRRADLYGLAEQWINLPDVPEGEGLSLLLRRYLAAFGPAPLSDAANWAGVRVDAMKEAVQRVRVRMFEDADARVLFDVPNAPLPPSATPVPVRFLPTWDAVLLVHARRSGVLPEEYRPLVFHTRNPQSVATVLVDGRVAGTWRFDDGHIVVSPYEKHSSTVMAEVRREGERLEAFHLE